jgi:2-octaprenyl-6-methoxyphenol hydroxylase
MPKTQSVKADVIISGGGVAGLVVAALLGQAGLDIHIIDPAPPQPLKDTAPSARTVALMQSSIHVIKSTGMWDKISEHANPLRTMRIIDPNGDIIDTDFEASDIGLPQFGYNIPNNILRAALYEVVKKLSSVTWHSDTLLHYSVDNSVHVELSEQTISGSLLVGVDGRKSKVRQIAGIDCKTKDYGQSAITCIVAHSRSHNDTATEFHRPSGPLAFVPLPGNRCSVVWIEPTDRANQIIKLRKNEFTAALQEAGNSILGALELQSTPEAWPIASLKADRLTAPRVAIAAEAAHVMSPVTAQGLNLSLRDIAALAETIVDAARAGLDIGSETVLNKYERRRIPDIRTRVFGVDSMNSIIKTEFGFIRGLRRNGLKTVSSVPPLKKFAMRHGLAPDIDAGRLMKGLPL